jgi:hypothetical protein
VSSVTNETVSKALELWNAGQATKAGGLLYEQVPIATRPLWAARILDLCRRLRKSPLAVNAVYAIAVRRYLWRWGHVAFRAVRRLTLQYEKGKNKDEVYGGLLYLAENVAKVAYNATDPPDPFDYDAGASVISCLRHLVNKVDDPEFETKAWLFASRTDL